MKARLAPRARADLRAAVRWIGRDDLEAARDFRNLVNSASILIAANPAIGSRRTLLTGDGYRCWPLQRYPYLIVYSEKRSPPEIARIIHSARDLPGALADLRD